MECYQTNDTKNVPGYLILLGENEKDCAIYFGWAPKDGKGVSDLVALVQRGYPGKIRYLGHAFGTPAEVDDLRAKFEPARIPGTSAWFDSCEQIDSIFEQLRGTELDDDDDEEA